jgi:hypothetical protein
MAATEEPGMDATQEMSVAESMVMLGDPVILDENVRCTELRTSLLQFFINRPTITNLGSGSGVTAGRRSGG